MFIEESSQKQQLLESEEGGTTRETEKECEADIMEAPHSPIGNYEPGMAL